MKKNLCSVLSIAFSINVTAQIALPYSQDFEIASFPPIGWQTFPVGSPVNWIYDNTVSAYGIGSGCTSFDNFNNTSGYYGIRLPAMNFATVSQPYVRFDIAYAQRTSGSSDIFGFWWSNNGTSNWQNIQNYSYATLATAPLSSALFVPAANQWQTKLLSLASLAGLPFVRLAIEDDCAHGNMIYFDNVTVFDSAATGITEMIHLHDFVVSPTLITDDINIYSSTLSGLPQQIEIYNTAGELLFSEILMKTKETIDVSKFHPGIYFVRVNNKIQKIVKL